MIRINIERIEGKNDFSRLYKINGLISLAPFEQSLQWLKNKKIDISRKIGVRGYRLGNEILQLNSVIEIKISHSWLVVILKSINREQEEELNEKWKRVEEKIQEVISKF